MAGTETMSAAEYRKLMGMDAPGQKTTTSKSKSKKKRPRKFTSDGHIFDSEGEYGLYRTIKELFNEEDIESQFKIPGGERNFRYDFKLHNILIEYNGGVWSRGDSGHSSGTGLIRDANKQNYAAIHGYHTLTFTSSCKKEYIISVLNKIKKGDCNV